MQCIPHFRPELLPPARTFYERELGKLTRPNHNGWAATACPFHASKGGKSFGVNLDTGGFHCFGCDARGGDVVSFIMIRDRLSFKAAAQSLGAWDVSPSPETVRKLAEQRRERERQKQEEQARQAEQRRQRLALREDIYTAARVWREASERLSELRRGSSPISDVDEETCWAVMQWAIHDLRDSERQYCAAAGLEYTE